MKISRREFGALAIATLVAKPAFAMTNPRWYDDGSGLAVGGHDIVAYFDLDEDADAVMGDVQFQTQYKGGTFQFASEANRDRFEMNPEHYIHRFGGHCAFAMSKGSFAKGDPNAWTIYNGVLYLNFNKDVRTRWKADIDANIERADSNWAGFFPGEK